jgi:hypothetical protein
MRVYCLQKPEEAPWGFRNLVPGGKRNASRYLQIWTHRPVFPACQPVSQIIVQLLADTSVFMIRCRPDRLENTSWAYSRHKYSKIHLMWTFYDKSYRNNHISNWSNYIMFACMEIFIRASKCLALRVADPNICCYAGHIAYRFWDAGKKKVILGVYL